MGRTSTPIPWGSAIANTTCPPYPCVERANFSTTGADPQGVNDFGDFPPSGEIHVANHGSNSLGEVSANGNPVPPMNVRAGTAPEGVAGVFHIRVFANDSVGESGTAVMVLTITATPGLPPTTFYELVTGLFVVAVATLLALAVLQRRRQQRRENARWPVDRTKFSRMDDAGGSSSEPRGDRLKPPPGS